VICFKKFCRDTINIYRVFRLGSEHFLNIMMISSKKESMHFFYMIVKEAVALTNDLGVF